VLLDDVDRRGELGIGQVAQRLLAGRQAAGTPRPAPAAFEQDGRGADGKMRVVQGANQAGDGRVGVLAGFARSIVNRHNQIL